jgi:hypothetical protein
MASANSLGGSCESLWNLCESLAAISPAEVVKVYEISAKGSEAQHSNVPETPPALCAKTHPLPRSVHPRLKVTEIVLSSAPKYPGKRPATATDRGRRQTECVW